MISKERAIVKLLALTQSDSDNEALAAIRKANFLLRSLNMQWHEIVDFYEGPIATTKPIKNSVLDDFGKLQAVLEWAEDNDWFDTDFILSLESSCEKFGELTPKQRSALDNIIEKCRIPI